MKVLWITNIPIGKQCKLTGTSQSTGGWMTAALETLIGNNQISICIVTTWPVKKRISIKESNIVYTVIPDNYPIKYNFNKKKNIKEWKHLVNDFKPDLIHLWGTEFQHSLSCIRIFKNIPIITYIQGIVTQIARQYLSGMNSLEQIRATSIRDIIKLDTIYLQKYKFYIRSRYEKEILKLSQAVIVDNTWAKIQCLAINPNLIIYKSNLPINKVFFNTKWEFKDIEEYSIMSNASGYPIKGLHILLKALSLIKKHYPMVKLKIPGHKIEVNPNLRQKIFNPGYYNYIAYLIRRMNLEGNLAFLGLLTPEQMAHQMKKSHVFVVPSSIENHSSTLREAMIIGTPCITSFAGGINEIVSNGKNAFIYRFEEYEAIAYYISEIFSSKLLAENISNNSKNSMFDNYLQKSTNNDLISIYRSLLNIQ